MAMSRRTTALERLKTQLKSGQKPDKKNPDYQEQLSKGITLWIPLTKKDEKRINREIETLEERLDGYYGE